GVECFVGGGRCADAGCARAFRHADPAQASATAVITPRRTRLVRVPHLAAFRAVIIDLATSAPPARPDATCVVVPTRGAARQLALRLQANRSAIVTRDELYDQLHARLSDPPRRLTSLERDVIVQAAA